MWKLHPKGVHHTCLKIFLYGDHSPKHYKVSTMVFTIISTFYFFKASYSHIMLLQVLIQLTTWNYWMQIMSQKLQSLPLKCLKEKSGLIVNHIHQHLFSMYQTNCEVSHITFHLSMDRFYIIWSLGLLLSQNSYVNYS